MGAAWRQPGEWAAVAAALVLAASLRAQPMASGHVLPLAVRDGLCTCVLPTGQADAKYLLVIGSLARSGGPFRVTVQTGPAAGRADVPLDPCEPSPEWRRQNDTLRERLARAREREGPEEEFPPAAPQRRRTFYLFVGDRRLDDPAGYAAVTGELRTVGRHCQVYVDREQPDPARLQPTIEDLVRTFDGEVYPAARRRLGVVRDVDRDGRFTILLTAWLGRMGGGKVALGGFVRGSDFDRDQPAPFGNRCDMMYLNSDLRPGPHLRTLLAHEYTHAVVFCEHVYGNYLPEVPRQDEESWLNEGLAHLNEARHGYGWSNLDYRVSAFLSAPEASPLVVPDAYSAGLWRNPGHRGAAYLFLRWCADHSAGDLPARLIRTNLTGTANLEAAIGTPFAELFRRWSIALALDGTGVSPGAGSGLYGPLGGRLLCGPRFTEVALASCRHTTQIAGTAAAYFLLHSPGAAGASVRVRADPFAQLQVSLVPMPSCTGRLNVRVLSASDAGCVRLAVSATDANVTLDGAAWERQAPAANRVEDTSYRPGQPAVPSWLGEPQLSAGTTRTSPALPLPPAGGPFVFKLMGTDAAGHRVAAWAVVPGTDRPQP